jgi:hypothetical protein
MSSPRVDDCKYFTNRDREFCCSQVKECMARSSYYTILVLFWILFLLQYQPARGLEHVLERSQDLLLTPQEQALLEAKRVFLGHFHASS